MKRPKKTLEVVLDGERFWDKVAWRVFVSVLERIGIDHVQRTYIMSITAERPEREDFYVRIADWWVRKHTSVDSMVGILTRLKDQLGLSMQIHARDVIAGYPSVRCGSRRGRSRARRGRPNLRRRPTRACATLMGRLGAGLLGGLGRYEDGFTGLMGGLTKPLNDTISYSRTATDLGGR